MAVWAIADLHLSFGIPNKGMEVFGPQWVGHADKIRENWLECISPDDLVLIPGDISWAMTPDEAKADLEWIDALPGTKVFIRGNHDYWWTSLAKLQKVLPPSIHLIQNNAFFWNDVAVAGARFWDSSEYTFNEYVDYKVNPRENLEVKELKASEQEKIFQRELVRLETSLKAMEAKAGQARLRLVMTHYPPIGADLAESAASILLEKYKVDVCVFGHLHNLKPEGIPFGIRNHVKYLFVACDGVNFMPVKID